MSSDLPDQLNHWISQNSAPVLAKTALAGADSLYFLHFPAARSDAPRVLVTAGTHGDEPAGTAAVLAWLQEDAWPPDIHWYIFPCLNPGGLRRGTRENPLGIDINRDFRRFEAVETRFFRNEVMAVGSIDLAISLHEDWEFPQSYLYEINTGTLPSMAPDLLSEIKSCTGLVEAPLIDDHVPSAPGLIVHPPDPDEPENWPEAIYLVKQQPLLSYTIETSSQLPLDRRVECHHRVLRKAAEKMKGVG